MSEKSQKTAEDIMTKDVAAFTMQMTVGEAMEILVTKKISGAPVVDQSNTVMTVMSEFDLMKFAAAGLLNNQIVDVMDKLPKDLVSVDRSATLVEVFKVFLSAKVRRVVVVDSLGKLNGLISRHDIVSMFYKEYKKE